MKSLEKKGRILELRVKDLMTKNVISVSTRENIMNVALVMTVNDISSVLLKSEDKFVGIMTDRDIISKIVALGLNPKEIVAGEVMTSPLTSISEDASVQESAEKMREKKIRRLVVRNKKEEVVGIISESDIVKVEPELHFLIRERSRLGIGKISPLEPRQQLIEGYCEECKNYSEDLKNVSGRWLCEDCRK